MAVGSEARSDDWQHPYIVSNMWIPTANNICMLTMVDVLLLCVVCRSENKLRVWLLPRLTNWTGLSA